jgi:hypothetical protein
MTPPPHDQTAHLTRDSSDEEARQPDWWHRDHPTFTALAGFFSGLAYIVLVPALFAGLLNLVFDDDTADDLFPLVLVGLALPLGLLAGHRTRRFGGYLLIGMVVTALVVSGVAGLVIWFMVQRDL